MFLKRLFEDVISAIVALGAEVKIGCIRRESHCPQGIHAGV
jgi:hypothetical protein